ncbi:MAG: hypothetical protein JNL32_10640 [Candidatus Kapabacteria bacterium]|nr:hypothetical protein [Candidatus Kapabacteria bacterium]
MIRRLRFVETRDERSVHEGIGWKQRRAAARLFVWVLVGSITQERLINGGLRFPAEGGFGGGKGAMPA